MDKNKKTLLPSITLAEIYGPNHILNPRASFSNYGWIANKPRTANLLTGAPLTVAGDMPIICSHTVSTEGSLSLLQLANLSIAPFRHEYRTRNEYSEMIDLLIQKKKKFVINHLHPPDEINDQGYWINPKLLAFLNNKGNLEKLVPSDHIPRRILIHPSEINASESIKLPIVIKVATEKPNVGGRDVAICHKVQDLKKAQKKFASCELVLMEEYLPIKKNYCVQFAKTFAGDMIYLGTTEQITNSSGNFLGSWTMKEDSTPESVLLLGQKIMQNACSMGYRGVAGFDIVLTHDDRIMAIDLNFRLNGSTPTLLLSKSIFKHLDASVLLYSSWKAKLKFSRFSSVCEKMIKEGSLVPLIVYNPESSSNLKSRTRLNGILLGTTQQDIIKKRLPQFKNSLLK